MLTDIWEEFVSLLSDGSLAAIRIRPHALLQDSLPGILETMQGYLETMRAKADWTEWQASPEVHRVGSQVHFLLPLTFDGQRNTFCFSFLVKEGQWYWQHVESIVIRLDQLAPLPATEFPDIPEAQKAWMREELRVAEQVRLFAWLVAEKGRGFAFDWFRDGPGYVLAARTWVPFVEPARAFIFYVCWQQAKLRGSRVTLVKLAEREALVEIEPIYLRLYRETGHLRQQISWEDYRQLFEAIWQDRAYHAGWKLEMSYHGETCTLHLAG